MTRGPTLIEAPWSSRAIDDGAIRKATRFVLNAAIRKSTEEAAAVLPVGLAVETPDLSALFMEGLPMEASRGYLHRHADWCRRSSEPEAFPEDEFVDDGPTWDTSTGGFVQVCRSTRSGRRVVVKHVLRSTLRGRSWTEIDGEDHEAEIATLKVLSGHSCPNLPQLLGFFRSEAHVEIVMDYRGQDYFSVLEARAASNTPASRQELASHLVHLTTAAKHMHDRSIAHLDINLENLSLQEDRGIVTLIDMGACVVCKSRDGSSLRFAHKHGKPYYRCPESYLMTPTAALPQHHVRRTGGKTCFAHQSRELLDMEVQICRPAGEPGTVAQLDPRRNRWWMCEFMLPAGNEGDKVTAEMVGYDAMCADAFSIGVTAAIMFCRVPPVPFWVHHEETDRMFRWLMPAGRPRERMAALLGAWNCHLGADMAHLVNGLCETNPALRLSVDDAVGHPALQEAVPLSAAVAAANP